MTSQPPFVVQQDDPDLELPPVDIIADAARFALVQQRRQVAAHGPRDDLLVAPAHCGCHCTAILYVDAREPARHVLGLGQPLSTLLPVAVAARLVAHVATSDSFGEEPALLGGPVGVQWTAHGEHDWQALTDLDLVAATIATLPLGSLVHVHAEATGRRTAFWRAADTTLWRACAEAGEPLLQAAQLDPARLAEEVDAAALWALDLDCGHASCG